MLATDLQPTRLAAAKNVASRFIKNRTHDKIGLVVFAGEAFSLCPLTTDYRVLQSYIDLIEPSLIPAAGTAIGSALAVGINRLRDIPGSNKAIILLSDGDNTAGSLPPEIASELAKSFNIRIYSIALGTQNAAEINRDILKEVAGTGQGQFFDASSATNLQAVFHQIESLEKARLLDHFRQEFSDYYTIYLRWALVFFILALVFRVSPLGNILED
jgi:Ca-activated chloride channel family protein